MRCWVVGPDLIEQPWIFSFQFLAMKSQQTLGDNATLPNGVTSMQASGMPFRVCCEAKDSAGNPSSTPRCHAAPLPVAPPRITLLHAKCAASGAAFEISFTTTRPARVAYTAIAVTPGTTAPEALAVAPSAVVDGSVGDPSDWVASGQALTHSRRPGSPTAHAALTSCPIRRATAAIAVYAVTDGSSSVTRMDVNMTAVCSDEAQAAAKAEECNLQDFLRHLKPRLTPPADALVFPAGRPIISTPAADAAAGSAVRIGTLEALQDVLVIGDASAATASVGVTAAAEVRGRGIPVSISDATPAALDVSSVAVPPVRISAAILTPHIYLEPQLAAAHNDAPANTTEARDPLAEAAVTHLEFAYSLRDSLGNHLRGSGMAGTPRGGVGLNQVRVVAALVDGDGVLTRLGGCVGPGSGARRGWGRCRAVVPEGRFPAPGAAPVWTYAALELQVRSHCATAPFLDTSHAVLRHGSVSRPKRC